MAEHDQLARESIDSSFHQMSELIPADGSSFRPTTTAQHSTNPNVFSDDYSIDSVDSPLVPHHRRSASISSTDSSSTIGPRRPDVSTAAVPDYNMQLMLLEQQNKRRLLMARQQMEQAAGLTRTTSRHSLMQPQSSTTPGDETPTDPFADQPSSSSQNDVTRRSSMRKDIDVFNRRSTVSVASTRSGYQPVPRAMSPYQGATGPSHPYAMYPQVGVSRTASVATTSTMRPDGPLRGRTAPSHPYAMYPQNIDYEEDLGDRPIPMGFPAENIQAHQSSSQADEVGDIIGPDGHLEQLPPYTRYPDGIIRPTRSRGPASIASAMRESRESYHDEPLTHSESSRTLINVDSSEPLRPSGERSSRRSSTLVAFDEKMYRRSQRKCCGAPVWLLALLGLGMLIGGLIGGVIGGVLGERAAERRGKEAAAARHSASPTVVTITETTDVSPYSSAPTGLLPLPTGRYQVPYTLKNTSKFCFASSTEVWAWSCHIFNPLPVQVMGSVEQGSILLEQETINGQFTYGAQQPFNIQPPQQNLTMMKDKEDLELGPALFFTTSFNKLVIVPEQQVTMSKRSTESNILNDGWVQQQNAASVGDKPWFCWWNQTQIEVFIYVNETQGASTAATTTGSNTAPAYTSNTGAATSGPTSSGPMPTSRTGPSNSRRDVITGNYPRKVKIKENRVVSGAPQAYCQQMQVNPDNSVTPINNNLIEINESQPSSGSSKRDLIYERDTSQSPCYCEWLTT